MENISRQVDAENNTTIVGTVCRVGVAIGEFVAERLIVRYVILFNGEVTPLAMRAVSGNGKIKQDWALTLPGDTVRLVINKNDCLADFRNMSWGEPGAAQP